MCVWKSNKKMRAMFASDERRFFIYFCLHFQMKFDFYTMNDGVLFT